MKLTIAAVKAMSHNGRAKDIRWDERVPGFGLRLLPSGRKDFIVKYRERLSGRQRYLTLGRFGTITPDQAFELAKATLANVAHGGDPQAERRRRRQGETVADLGKAYLARHARAHNKSWEKDQERLDAYIVPVLGRMKIEAVTRADVARLHSKIGQKHPTTANRVLALLSSMWNRARLDFGLLPQSHPNPTEGIKRFTETKRDRFVTSAEMPQLAAAIDAEPGFHLRALIWLYLFTGLRKSELIALRWEPDPKDETASFVDLELGQIRLGKTKAGRPHYLPVTSLLADVFRQIPKVAGNPYVFPGRGKDHLVNVSKPWLRIRKAAGLGDVRLHDLRRTVGSWMAQDGRSLALIGRVLNHSNQSTTAVYAHFHLDPVAEALEFTGRRLKAAAAAKEEPQASPPGETGAAG